MKYLVKIISVLALLCGLVLGQSRVTQARPSIHKQSVQTPARTIIATRETYIYAACNFEVGAKQCAWNKELARIKEGDKLTVLSGPERASSGNTVYHVRFLKWTGWVDADYMQSESEQVQEKARVEARDAYRLKFQDYTSSYAVKRGERFDLLKPSIDACAEQDRQKALNGCLDNIPSGYSADPQNPFLLALRTDSSKRCYTEFKQASVTSVFNCGAQIVNSDVEITRLNQEEKDSKLTALKECGAVASLDYCQATTIEGKSFSVIPDGASSQISPSAQPVPLPLCAENGSCYGDLNKNGVPKTVGVHGYYRKDGTHVRGYYRSAPGSNPKVK